MFLLFLPVVYASLYDHETMLEKMTLQTEVTSARAYHEYVDQMNSDILSHGWDYNNVTSAEEMFRITIPILEGMGLTVLKFYNYSDELLETVESCGELYVNGTAKMDSLTGYFSNSQLEPDMRVDVGQNRLHMEEELRFIDELCTSIYDTIKSLYEMLHASNEWNEILLTRAKMILEHFENIEEAARYTPLVNTVNYTEAKHNFTIMQDIANMIYTIHKNLTSEENEYI